MNMQFGEKENLRYMNMQFADAGSVDMLLIEQYLNLKS